MIPAFLENKREIFFYGLAAVLGLVSIITPPLITPGIKQYDHPLWPAVVTGIEGINLLTIVLLGLSGMILGLLNPKGAWRWGAATMVPFPLFAIVDILAFLYPHQMWPFEFLMYVILTIPAILGSLVGAFVRHRIEKRDMGRLK